MADKQKPSVLCCSNDDFRAAVARQEAQDGDLVAAKLQRVLDGLEGARCGISRLRSFLEDLLRQRYLENVPTILALVDKEFRATVRRLLTILSYTAALVHVLYACEDMQPSGCARVVLCWVDTWDTSL